MVSEGELAQLMTQMDANNDGAIVMAEFLATMMDWDQLQMDKRLWRDYVASVFKRLDHNGDGWVSLDEIFAELGTAAPAAGSSSDGGSGDGGAVPSGMDGQSVRSAEARRMLREADTDGDGRISLEVLGD